MDHPVDNATEGGPGGRASRSLAGHSPWWVAALVVVAAAVVVATALPIDEGGDGRLPPAAVRGIWISTATIAELPTEGAAWEGVHDVATGSWEEPDLEDNDSFHDVQVLAGALVARRLGDQEMYDRVVDGLDDVTGEFSDEVLPAARNVLGYVVAADLVGHQTPAFERWLRQFVDEPSDGRAGIGSLRESAITDPSNHGNHARASVFAIARYLGDGDLEQRVVNRFHDWLGRSGAGFVWKERHWQVDPETPVGINPPGSEMEGLDVDGVLPEEQRRSGGFTTDPERESYVWEGLQGVTAAAAMMERAGHPAWQWEDCAILRAFRWLHRVNDYPAEGDDVWQAWLVNWAYGTSFPASTPTEPGKNMGFTDWTHASADSAPRPNCPGA